MQIACSILKVGFFIMFASLLCYMFYENLCNLFSGICSTKNFTYLNDQVDIEQKMNEFLTCYDSLCTEPCPVSAWFLFVNLILLYCFGIERWKL